jgi:hypothetical protein
VSRVNYNQKKRFFPKPKKDLPADTREDPFLVSEKEGFVSNLLLINGKNGSVQKVRYETFLKFFNKGSVQKVRHETFIEQFQKGSAQKVRYGTFLKLFNKGSVQKVRYETFTEKFKKGSVHMVS